VSESIIAERCFTSDDVLRFAEASGDWNPVHVDSIHARRLLTGKVVVHGMLTLLWALEEYCADIGEPVTSIAANFLRPVGVDDHLILIKDEAESDSLRLAIRCDGTEVATILLRMGGKRIDKLPYTERPIREVSEDNSFLDLKQRSSSIKVMMLQEDLLNGFAHIERVMGAMLVASLHTLSRLVGMTCPGLHSLFTGLNIRIDPSMDVSEIDWSVIRHSVPQAPLRLSLKGTCITGHLDVFVRPAPVAQVGIQEVSAKVNPSVFSDQVALIVGGSRGLGELTAKIVAAGGGRSVVTYHQGASDADRVVSEIVEWGGQASAISLDVDDPQPAIEKLKKQGLILTHIYYFAAPRISSNKDDEFDVALWHMFASVFVEGFSRVIHCVKKSIETDLKVFYPSTVYIDEQLPEFCEYISAKSAGETLCDYMTKNIKGVQVLFRRLPRVPTDQTAGLIRLTTAEPLPLMLEVVNEMQFSTT
jgi:NADP-dependent 3-hydroxy acid dehydrogenase YdfG